MKNEISKLTVVSLLILSFTVVNAQNDLSESHIDALIIDQCEGGSIDLTIMGGLPPYDVLWTDQFGISVSSAQGIQGSNDGEDLENMRPGTYKVHVTDAACGTAELEVEIDCVECPSMILWLSNPGLVDCAEMDGSLTVFLSQEVNEPANILWSTGESSNVIDGLGAGYYSVTVTDSRGCSSEAGFTIKCCPGISDPDITDYCSNTLKGSITFDPGLESQYYIDWTGPNGFTASGADIDNLEVGDYTVTFDDDRTCSVSYTFTIKQQEFNYQTINFRNPDCSIPRQGEIEIEVEGDATISWYEVNQGYPVGNPIGFGPSISVDAGEYMAVIDIDGCTGTTGEYRLVCCDQVDPIEEEYITNIQTQWTSGVGVCDGSATYNVNIAPWRSKFVVIENMATGEEIYSTENLCEGTYCITVNDGCDEQTECFTIEACEELQIGAIVTNTCFGVQYGEISAFPYNGKGPYQFAWHNGRVGSTIRNLSTGFHRVTVTDAHGCTGADEFYILPSNPITNMRRTSCTVRKACNNRHVPHLDIPYNETNTLDKLTCTYTNRCSDGYLLPSTKGHTEWRDDSNAFTCQEREYCEGLPTTKTKSGTVRWQWALFECVEEEYCNGKKTGKTRKGTTYTRTGSVGCQEETVCAGTGRVISTRQVATKQCKRKIFTPSGSPEQCEIITYCPLDNATIARQNGGDCKSIALPFCSHFPLTGDDDIAESLGRDLTGDMLRLNPKHSSNEKVLVSSELSVYPNPFSSSLTIEFYTAQNEEVEIDIVTAHGQKVISYSLKSESGRNILTIDPDSPVDGLHFIDITSGSINERLKVLKIK